MVYIHAVRLLVRQEGGGDVPSIPEEPVLDPSPMPHHPGGVPEIGGSSTGFVVLVVALSSFILISCIGIFVLLQRHKADPFERHARRVLSGQRSETMYEMPLGPKGMREKFRSLFTLGRRKREGWVRANSAEETWDASEDLLPRQSSTSHHGQEGTRDMQWVSDDAPSYHQHHVTRSETSESIQLSAANPRDSLKTLVTDLPRASKISYTDPFSVSPTSVLSREGFEETSAPAAREDSTNSRPAHLFANGTRFKESLDF